MNKLQQQVAKCQECLPGGSMPRCLKCGKSYHAKYISGFCDDCLQVDHKDQKPTTLPKASHVSVESYEKEVERVQAAQDTPQLKNNRPAYTNWTVVLAFIFVGILLLASLAITVIAFGLTKHGIVWSLSIFSFFVGAIAILTKRLLGKRVVASDGGEQNEAAIASAVGGVCLLPLALCTFYYGMNADMPPNHSLWVVGFMLVAALVAVVGSSVALSKTNEGQQTD